MSQFAPFTLQVINPTTGQAIGGASVTITNRVTNLVIIPYATEAGTSLLVNLQTNSNGLAQGWLPIGPYQATIASVFLPAPLLIAWDSVPYSSGLNAITVSGNVTPGYVLTAVNSTEASWQAGGGGGSPTGTAGGDLSGSYPNPTVASVLGGSTPLIAPNNLSDLTSASSARSNLGLGTAATQNTSAFDAAGTSATETTRAEAAEALLAPLASPALTGSPTAPTPPLGDKSTRLATTAFVATASGVVTSVFGRFGAVVANTGDYTNSQITGSAPLASPALTGVPTAPTAAPGTNTTQIATTAYVLAASGIVSSVFGRTGIIVAQTGDYTYSQVTGAAPTANPTFTGTVTVPTQTTTDNSTKAASTAFVQSLITITTRSYAGTSDTLVQTDNGNRVESSGNSSVVETVPSLTAGTYIEVCQIGTGQITFSAGGGVNIISPGSLVHTAGQYASVGVFWRTNTSVILSGNLA